MSVDLRRLLYIEQDKKYCISGYIREESKLFASKKYSIFNNIPDIIQSLCTLYAEASDYFKIIPEGVSTGDGGDETSICKYWKNAKMKKCYGSVVIPSLSNCIALWKLKVINVPLHWDNPNGEDYGEKMIVGIASTESSENEMDELGKYYYGNYHDIDSEYEIEITLNLQEDGYSTKYFMGGSEMFHNVKRGKNIEYRLAVGLMAKGTHICITKFNLKS